MRLEHLTTPKRTLWNVCCVVLINSPKQFVCCATNVHQKKTNISNRNEINHSQVICVTCLSSLCRNVVADSELVSMLCVCVCALFLSLSPKVRHFCLTLICDLNGICVRHMNVDM